MAAGIFVCGLNGAGKSTLGKALAEKLNFYFIDNEDLYEQEERFFEFVKSRAENTVEKWIQALNCPVIRIDGMKSIEENINFIIERI